MKPQTTLKEKLTVLRLTYGNKFMTELTDYVVQEKSDVFFHLDLLNDGKPFITERYNNLICG